MTDMYDCNLAALTASLQGCVYTDVSGYEEKYFPTLSGPAPTKASPAEARQDASLRDALAEPSLQLSELARLLNDVIGPSASSCTFIPDPAPSPDAASGSTACVFLARDAPTAGTKRPEAAALVLGVLQPTDGPLVAFCAEAARVFAARPDRRFLHAFRIRRGGGVMETWTFDRAGAYSGEALRVADEPGRLRRVVAGYAAMTDAQLGLNTALRRGEDGVVVRLEVGRPAAPTTLVVEEEPFVRQDGLLGAGTTCFEGRGAVGDRSAVVKFAWTAEAAPAETALLSKANDAGVWGVPTLEAYLDLGDVAGLRAGLVFGEPCAVASPAGAATTPQEGSDAAGDAAEKFENLRLACVVTSPLGRPLATASSPPELLGVLRDVVRALRSLREEAGMLHRDVSPANVIVVPGRPPRGMLIDFDLALDLAAPPAERRLIGSEGFMAIGILGGDDHTYRHDLESLFYVLLHVAVCPDVDRVPEGSRLAGWRGTDFLAVFHRKRSDMQRGEFGGWLEEEVQEEYRCCLGLIWELYDVLFPVRNGKMFIGTDQAAEAVEMLYESIMQAFSRHMLMLG